MLIPIVVLGMSFTIGCDGKSMTKVQGELIAFFSDRDGDYEIYVMGADGSNVVKLTDNTAGDFSPSWSPDGQRIAFFSDRDGDYEIYVMDTNGSNVVKLTDNTVSDRTPSWVIVE